MKCPGNELSFPGLKYKKQNFQVTSTKTIKATFRIPYYKLSASVEQLKSKETMLNLSKGKNLFS